MITTPPLITTQTTLPELRLIEPPTHFRDFRGEYVELYNRQVYCDAGVKIEFVQDDISVSHRHVLRGIHGDQETWKLVSCLLGRFQLAVVDWRDNSPRFGKYDLFELSDQNRLQVLIPPGFGNGHLVLSEKAIFHYKQSTYYNPKGQFTVLWNDPRLNIPWASSSPILSSRDGGNLTHA